MKHRTKYKGIRDLSDSAWCSRILCRTCGKWFHLIVYNGKVGYSLASYLESPYGQLQTYVDDYLGVINCNESITLRTAPSTSAG